ncbi:sulfate transporter [Alicycliphilus sp. B1]|nr:sulfate transporter [Alicycliphilus sp. B1]
MQIGGPAGAFIVIVYGIVQQYGVANLIIATALSGVLLFLMGVLQLGTLVRFIPVAVVIGFTNGIAVLIALSQVKDFLGLAIEKMPGDFFGMLGALYQHLSTLNPWAAGVSSGVAGAGRGLAALAVRMAPSLGRQARARTRLPSSRWCWRPPWWRSRACRSRPSAAASAGIPAGLPAFTLPDFSWESARHLLMPTITLALLGCDRVAAVRPRGRRHGGRPPRPEPGADGAGHRQLRHAVLRRHARHRHHRAHGDQREKRRHQPRRRHGACAGAAAGDAGGRSAGRVDSSWPRWRRS